MGDPEDVGRWDSWCTTDILEITHCLNVVYLIDTVALTQEERWLDLYPDCAHWRLRPPMGAVGARVREDIHLQAALRRL